MAYDIEQIRASFPALGRRVNDKPIVFFDNPAGTQVPWPVIERMQDALVNRNANLGGLFETSANADALVAEAHRAAERFVNAPNRGEIVFGQSMTALTFAFSRSICRQFAPGDEIILTRMDHDANIAPWLMAAEDHGLVVRWLNFSPDCFEFDLGDLSALINDRTKLIAICHASNVSGTINDIAAVGRIARDCGAILFVDSVQFAPHGLVDVGALNCDFLVCSAYKFFGPHYAFLWGKKSRLESLRAYKVRAVPDELPKRFTSGTISREALAGVHAALDYIAAMGECAEHLDTGDFRSLLAAGYRFMKSLEDELTVHLIQGLQSIRGVRVLGITDSSDFDRRVSTVSFVMDSAAPREIALALAQSNIQVWHGHNYALEFYRRIGLINQGCGVRIGPVHYNRLDEVDRALEVIDRLALPCRKAG